MNSHQSPSRLLGLSAFVLFVAILLVASLSSLKRTPQPIPTLPSSPTPASQPQPLSPPSPSPETTPSLGQVYLDTGLAQLSSFRATFILTATTFTLEGDEAVFAHLITVQEQARALNAENIMYGYADELHPQQNQASQQVRMGQSSFLVTEQAGEKTRCLAQPISQPDRWRFISLPYSDLGYLSDARYLGEEDLALGGSLTVRTRRFAVERSILGNFPAGRADIWVAVEGGYVIKLEAEASGQGDFSFQPNFAGSLTARYTLSHINQPVSIAPPTACTNGMPIAEDAEEISIVSNLITYKVNRPSSALVEFYTGRLQEQGWQPVGEVLDEEGVTTLAFQRDVNIASIRLSASPQGETVQVLIIVTAQ